MLAFGMLLFAAVTLAQGPPPYVQVPSGPNLSPDDWIPDCSYEGSPLPTNITNLHRYGTPDNFGTPRMDPTTSSSCTYYNDYNALKDPAVDAAADGDYMIVASEDAPGNVSIDNGSNLGTWGTGQVQYVANRGRIIVRKDKRLNKYYRLAGNCRR
jgi:hypothetical protein